MTSKEWYPLTQEEVDQVWAECDADNPDDKEAARDVAMFTLSRKQRAAVESFRQRVISDFAELSDEESEVVH